MVLEYFDVLIFRLWVAFDEPVFCLEHIDVKLWACWDQPSQVEGTQDLDQILDSLIKTVTFEEGLLVHDVGQFEEVVDLTHRVSA